jgi:transposase
MVRKKPNLSISLIKDMLEKHFNLKIFRSSVHNIMKSVGFSYITPRKYHYKQDKNEVDEVDKFKKN